VRQHPAGLAPRSEPQPSFPVVHDRRGEQPAWRFLVLVASPYHERTASWKDFEQRFQLSPRTGGHAAFHSQQEATSRAGSQADRAATPRRPGRPSPTDRTTRARPHLAALSSTATRRSRHNAPSQKPSRQHFELGQQQRHPNRRLTHGIMGMPHPLPAQHAAAATNHVRAALTAARHRRAERRVKSLLSMRRR